MMNTNDAMKLAKQDVTAACDLVVERAFDLMIEDMSAPPSLVIDRVLTRVGAFLCMCDGSPATANTFRQLADNIERGAFHALTGEGKRAGELN